MALLTFKVRSTSTPSYLHRLLQDREDVHNLRRRSATPALCRPFTKTTISKRAFRCTAPAVWNSLPKTVLDSGTVTSFKSRLKTQPLLSGFLSYSYLSLTHYLAQAPLKLRPYCAIQISLLLLLLLLHEFSLIAVELKQIG